MAKYYIEFNVAKDKKSIQSISVALDSEVITDMNAQFDVSLAAHPLYPQLEKYVLANPSPQKTPESTSKH